MEQRSCTNCMLFLVYGLPASGKTSLCRQLCCSRDFVEALTVTHWDGVSGGCGGADYRTGFSSSLRRVRVHHICFDAIERRLLDYFLSRKNAEGGAFSSGRERADEILDYSPEGSHTLCTLAEQISKELDGPNCHGRPFDRTIWRLARRLAARRVASLVKSAVRGEQTKNPGGEARIQHGGAEEESIHHVVGSKEKDDRESRKERVKGADERDRTKSSVPDRASVTTGSSRQHGKAGGYGCGRREGGECGLDVASRVGPAKHWVGGSTGKGVERAGRSARNLCRDKLLADCGSSLLSSSLSEGQLALSPSSPFIPPGCSAGADHAKQLRAALSPSSSCPCLGSCRRSASSPPDSSLFSPALATPRYLSATSSGTTVCLSRRRLLCEGPPSDLHVVLLDDTMHLGSMRKEYFRLATQCA